MKQFKRIISLVIAMTMLVSMFSVGMVSASAETQTYVLGDANGDGKVTILDATVIQRFVAGLEYEFEEGTIEYAAANVNKDDKISIFDATLIQQYVASYDSAMVYGIGETFTFGEIEEPTVPTEEPSSEDPTDEPSSENPTDEPSSEEPTEEPSSEDPTDEPSSEEPTEEPSSEDPTDEPSSEDPTDEPSSEDPTEEPELTEGYYMVGLFNGVDCWSADALTADRKLAVNPEADGEYILYWTFVGGDELKVAHFNGEEIDALYKAESEPTYKIGATSDKTGYCSVKFNPAGRSDWSYTYLTVKRAEKPVDPTDPTDEPSSDEPTDEPSSDQPSEVVPGYYLVGNLNGVDCWSVDALTTDRLLKANPGADGEYMLDWTFVGGDELKVAHFDGEKFDQWFNDGGDNYKIGADSNKVGPGTIYFRAEGNSEWSYFYFTVQPKTVDPTDEPTEEPTDEPTEEPTDEPTEEPTEEPTDEPTEEPTEKPTEAPTYTAYFVNSGKWSKVNAYAWDPANAAWPGQAMTKTADKAPNGADVYTITFKTNYANIIFNDGSSQTSDLKFQAGQYYDYATGKWYAKLSDIPAAAVTGYTVYCVNSKNWSTVNCYVWGPNGASWPGTKMTKTGEKSSKGYDIYSFNSVQNHTNCIFNNGSSQTSDLKFTAGQYFDLATGKWYADASTI